MKRHYLLAVVAIAAFLLSLWNFTAQRSPSLAAGTGQSSPEVSRLERLAKTNTLRVGYLIFPPYLSKDTASGKLSGIFYDVTEKLGGNLGVKVEWVEEVSLSALSLGFKANRFDMIAFPLWRSAARAKAVSFSVPLFYSTVGAYVRADDNRFDKDLSLLNSADIKVAAIDGELAEAIAKSDFPKAAVQSMQQQVDYSQLLLEVSSRKADVTFFNRVFGQRYLQKNPGSIKDLSGERPIRVFAECFILPIGDAEFNSTINAALLELIENGGVEDAFRKNGENPAEYYRTALPYRAPAAMK